MNNPRKIAVLTVVARQSDLDDVRIHLNRFDTEKHGIEIHLIELTSHATEPSMDKAVTETIPIVSAHISRICPTIVIIGQTILAEDILAHITMKPRPLVIRWSMFYGTNKAVYTPRSPIEAGYHLDMPKSPDSVMAILDSKHFLNAASSRKTSELLRVLPEGVKSFVNSHRLSEQLFDYDLKPLRQEGLILLHRGIARSFELGCHAQAKNGFDDAMADLRKAHDFFACIPTRHNEIIDSSNKRLAALSALQVASLYCEQGDYTQWEIYLAKAHKIFHQLNDSIGIAACHVVRSLNNHTTLDLDFDIETLLIECSKVISNDRVKDIMHARANDLNGYKNTAHVFPERSLLSLAIFHRCLTYSEWKHLFDENQKEIIPHFELEIVSTLVAFLLGVATSVTAGILTKMITDKTSQKKTACKDIDHIIAEYEAKRKLTYLLEGYALRQFYLENQHNVALAEYLNLWQSLKTKGTPPSECNDLYMIYADKHPSLTISFASEADNLLEKITKTVVAELANPSEIHQSSDESIKEMNSQNSSISSSGDCDKYQDGPNLLMNAWNQILSKLSVTISISDFLLANRISTQVSKRYNLTKTEEFLREFEWACWYSYRNTLEYASHSIQLSSSADVSRLLSHQISAWYYIDNGKRITPNYIADKLKERDGPFRYDRYIGHFMSQYALFISIWKKDKSYKWLYSRSSGVSYELNVIFNEYIANVAFWREIISWDEYIDAILGARFYSQTQKKLTTFRRQYLKETNLIRPLNLLKEIRYLLNKS